VIAAPFVWLRPAPNPQPTGPHLIDRRSADPTELAVTPSRPPAQEAGSAWWNRPVGLTDGWVITGATTTGSPRQPAYVLDRARNAYASYSTYDELWAAPSGNFAAVYDYDRRGETGLLNVPTGVINWVRTGTHILDPQWSPDGGRLLLTVMDQQSAGGLGAVIVTAANRQVREFSTDGTKYLCTDYCQFTWLPDGKEVALQQTDPVGERSEDARHPRRGLQLFSVDTGQPTRFLPIRGDVVGPYSWSPGGNSVVIQGQQEAQLVDASTGAVRGRLPSADAFWTGTDRLMYIASRDGNLIATEIDVHGNELQQVVLPPDLAGRQITVAPR
jgi:dipeptidyl aminopeptidase/acylaminoacyl peptidase